MCYYSCIYCSSTRHRNAVYFGFDIVMIVLDLLLLVCLQNLIFWVGLLSSKFKKKFCEKRKWMLIPPESFISSAPLVSFLSSLHCYTFQTSMLKYILFAAFLLKLCDDFVLVHTLLKVFILQYTFNINYFL